MQASGFLELYFEWLYGRNRQHRDAIFITLAIPDGNLPILKVNGFDPQPQTCHQAHATAVSQAHNQVIDTIQMRQNLLDF
jgi:hypothetical protein